MQSLDKNKGNEEKIDRQFTTLKYNELSEIDTTKNVIQLISMVSTNIVESMDSSIICTSITDLRRILKYNLDLFRVIFNNIYCRFITNILYNNDPEVQFNGLILILELFTQIDTLDEDILEWLPELTKACIELETLVEYSYIKGLIVRVLNTASQNIISNELLETICEYLCDKDQQKAEKAAMMFRTMLDSGHKHAIYACDNWFSFLRLVTEASMRRNEEEILRIRKILTTLQNILGEGFDQFLDQYFSLHTEKFVVYNLIKG